MEILAILIFGILWILICDLRCVPEQVDENRHRDEM